MAWFNGNLGSSSINNCYDPMIQNVKLCDKVFVALCYQFYKILF